MRPNEPLPELGPAMRALAPKWQKAVTALFITKGDRSAALRLAGYKGNPNANRVLACRMFQDPRMRAAVREVAGQMIEIAEPEILGVVLGIMRDENTEPKDKLRAAAMIWDRANPVMTKHKIEVEHHVSMADLEITHYRALKKIGAPHSAFLARFGANGLARVEAMVAADDAKAQAITHQPAIDGECEEIETEATE